MRRRITLRRFDISEALAILDATGSGSDPIKHRGEETYATELESHYDWHHPATQVRISYHANGKYKRGSTLQAMVADRLEHSDY